MPSPEQLDTDVAILGGGPAGTTTARLLVERGISATVLEAGNYSGPSLGQTLSPVLRPLLTQLGLITRLENTTNTICRGISPTWGSTKVYRNEYFWTPYGNGWHIERPVFDKDLSRIARRSGVRWFGNAKVRACEALARQKWSLRFATGGIERSLRCCFLVDATGRSGSFVPSLGGPRKVYDRLIGVAWSGRSSHAYPFTLIESVRDGWFYASQVGRSRCTVLLMTDSDIYRVSGPDFWHRQLRQAKHLREVFPESRKSNPQRIFSAATLVRTPVTGRNWLHVGDAALSLDPISGQGIYQALQSASQAAVAIDEHFRTGRSLRSYETWVGKSFESYTAKWLSFYAAEKRWPWSAFWKRRHFLKPVSRIDLSDV